MRNLLLAMSLAFLHGCAPSGEYEEATEASDAGGPETRVDPSDLLIVTATTYHNDFDDNAMSALSKYSFHPFFMKGVVDGVDSTGNYKVYDDWREVDQFGAATIKLKVDYSYYTVRAIVGDVNFAAGLKPGDSIVLLCEAVADIPLHAAADCYDAKSLPWADPAIKQKIFSD